MVSEYWDPNQVPVHNVRITLNYDCFSSWNFKNEITDKIASVQASSYQPEFLPVYSYSGFYGIRSNNAFKSQRGSNEWIVYELQSKVMIKKIIIKARNDPVVSTKMPGVVVKIGTVYNNDGDFTSFSDFGLVPITMDGQGIFILIDKSDSPVKGKYIVILPIPGEPLVISDIKITE